MTIPATSAILCASDEIIPETHRRGYEPEGTGSVIVGFLVMMFLDNVSA